MNYEETIRSLFEVLKTLNAADSDSAQDWQRPGDAHQAFIDVRLAITKLAGFHIVDHWAETNEVDMSLANRRKRG